MVQTNPVALIRSVGWLLEETQRTQQFGLHPLPICRFSVSKNLQGKKITRIYHEFWINGAWNRGGDSWFCDEVRMPTSQRRNGNKMRIFHNITVVFCLIVIGGTPPVVADVLVGSWTTHSIRRYDDSGNYLGDFVTSGSGGLNVPDGMDFGADGNLYVASSNSNAVLRYDGTTGALIDAFVSTGLSAPGNLQFGPDGFLYVCNKNLGQVLRFDPGNGQLESVFASGGGLQQPVGLLWKDGFLLVADFTGGAIRRFDAKTGNFVDNFALVNTPLILDTDAAGNVLVSSHSSSNILRFDESGTALGAFLNGGPVTCPVGHLVDSNGELLVASWQNHLLLRYDRTTGNYLGEFDSGNGLFRPNDLLRMPSAVLLGDVNGDGLVDLLDVAPFIELLTNGELQAEADINGDGVISLLDVAPFVEILSGK